MLGRRRRERRESERRERWAASIIAAARDASYGGPAHYDGERGIVVFGDHEVDLVPVETGLSSPTEAQVAARLEAVGRNVARRLFELPDDWPVRDGEVGRISRSVLERVAANPDAPPAVASSGRLRRHLGIDGWPDELRRAAELYEREEREHLARSWWVEAGLLYAELGDTASAERMGARLLAGPFAGRGVDDVHETEHVSFVFATVWSGGRPALAALAERAADERHVIATAQMSDWLIAAAAAAERGDDTALAVELERLERTLARGDRESGEYRFDSDHMLRHAVELVRSWAGDSSERAPDPEPDRLTATMVASRALPAGFGRPSAVVWRGGVAVAVGGSEFGIEVALDLDGREVPAPPTPATPPTPVPTIVADGERFSIRRADGTEVELSGRDDLAELGELEIVADHDRWCVFGEFGTFLVFDTDGRYLDQATGHERDPNLGARWSGGRLVTWAADGRMLVHDLELGVATESVDVGGWIDDADIDSTARLAVIHDDRHGAVVHDLRAGPIGPSRPAIRAAMHPGERLVAAVGDEHLWIERYE